MQAKRATAKAWLTGWLIIIATPLLQSCSSTETSAAPKRPELPVKLLTLSNAPVEDSTSFVGMLKSRMSVGLKPQVAGQVSAIYVKNGDAVPKGAKLIELDRSKQEATVNSCLAAIASSDQERQTALATLKSLEATETSKQSTVKYAQREHERYTLLHKEGAVSLESVDQWENQLKVGQGDLQSLQAQILAQKAMITKQEQMVKQAKATLKEQQEQLKYFTIFAPFDGIVGDIPIKVGEYVTTATALTTIDQRKPLELYLSVPAAQSQRLKLGMALSLLNSSGEPEARGTVFFISPEVDNNTQSVLVKSAIGNEDGKLRSGQETTVKLVWDHHSGVVVPSTAVCRLGGQDFVYVAEGSASQPDSLVAKQKPVKLGEIAGNNFIVLSGLKAGEKVVTSGTQNLTDGAPIHPES